MTEGEPDLIAVKTCGGCKEAKDPRTLLEQMRRDFPAQELQELTRCRSLPDVTVLLCGCEGRCHAHHFPDGRCGKFVLSGEEQYPKLVRFLEKQFGA